MKSLLPERSSRRLTLGSHVVVAHYNFECWRGRRTQHIFAAVLAFIGIFLVTVVTVFCGAVLANLFGGIGKRRRAR